MPEMAHDWFNKSILFYSILNESKIAALADLLSVFEDENECSSDKDDNYDE